ncbi:MAG: SurA N-terminal domain-containing protein [Gaiellales bacterium]
MRKALSLVVLLAAVAAFATACGGSGSSTPTVPSGDVAVVGDQKISQEQFDQLYQSAVKQGVANGQKAPKKGSTEEKTLQQQVLQSLVQNAEISQEADAKGIKVDQKKVQDDLKAFKLQCCQAKQAKYESYLKAQGLTEEQLTQQFELRQQAQALYDAITKDVKVTDEQAQKQYDKDKTTKYTSARSRKVAHILLDVPPKGKATAADCAKAAEVLKLVQAPGANWNALVKQYSADPGSKNTGGVYTITDDQNWDADFRKASFALKNTGDITDPPVKSQFGCHIIKALGPIKPAATKAFKDVKQQIIDELTQTEKNAAATKWFDGVQKDYASKSAFAKGYSLPPQQTTSTSTSG